MLVHELFARLRQLPGDRRRLAFLATLLIPATIVVVIYLPALANDLVWDDHITFMQATNYQTTSFAGIVKALSEPLIFDRNYFRPLPVLTFMLQVKWFGSSPSGLHLFSVLLHAANTLLLASLIYVAASGFAGSKRLLAALFGGLIYGLHPALIEPTVFIASRFDLLATFFLGTALLVDTTAGKSLFRLAGIALLFLLAALCKEMALALPMCLPLLHIARMENRPRTIAQIARRLWSDGHVHTYIAIFAGGVAYLVIRYATLGYILDGASFDRNDIGTLGNHAALVFESVSQYLTLIFLPFGKISVSHPVNLPATFSDTHARLGLLITLLAISVTIFLHVKNRFNPGWAVLALIASLFPVLNFLPTNRPTDVYFAESFLVFPIFAGTFLITDIWIRSSDIVRTKISPGLRSTLMIIPVTWILLGAITISGTIPFWKNDLMLWGWVLNDQKKLNPTALNNYTNGLILQERYPEAVESVRQALRLNPKNSQSWNKLAVTLYSMNRFKEAERAHKTAIKLRADIPHYFAAYGNTLFRLHRYEEAKLKYLRAIEISPEFANAKLYLALTYKQTGELDLAEKYMREALTTMPPGQEKDTYTLWLKRLESRTQDSAGTPKKQPRPAR